MCLVCRGNPVEVFGDVSVIYPASLVFSFPWERTVGCCFVENDKVTRLEGRAVEDIVVSFIESNIVGQREICLVAAGDND